MTVIRGQVTQVYQNTRPPMTALTVSGHASTKFSSYDKVEVEIGQVIEFNEKLSACEKYHNIKGPVMQLTGAAAEAAVAGAPSVAPPSAVAPSGADLPVKLCRDRAIIRQNALTGAINFHGIRGDADEMDIIKTAAMFEKYTSGDLDQEVLNNILNPAPSVSEFLAGDDAPTML